MGLERLDDLPKITYPAGGLEHEAKATFSKHCSAVPPFQDVFKIFIFNFLFSHTFVPTICNPFYKCSLQPSNFHHPMKVIVLSFVTSTQGLWNNNWKLGTIELKFIFKIYSEIALFIFLIHVDKFYCQNVLFQLHLSIF